MALGLKYFDRDFFVFFITRMSIKGKTLNRKKVAEISEGPLKNVRNYCSSTFQHSKGKTKSVGTVLKLFS